MSDEVASIRYWFGRAEESYQEAELMAASSHWNTCVNRLYYSCFYAVTALLLKRGHTVSRHAGARSLFNRDFIRSGLISRDFAGLYNRLFDNRQEADYAAMVAFGETEVRPWLLLTPRFLDEIRKLLDWPEGPAESG